MVTRRWIGMAIGALLLVACQSEPTPSSSAIHGSASPSAAVASPPTASGAAAEPSPATVLSDDEWSALIDPLAEDLGTALATQYDGVEADVLARWFTPEGLESALRQDWQLRDVERGELRVDGAVQLRAATTSGGDQAADPPLVEVELGFVIKPPSAIVDARTGVILERFDEHRYFGATYALRYEADADRFRVTAVAPLGGDLELRPAAAQPAVRCPGLDPDAPSSHPTASIAWCFGGEDGTLAPSTQVVSWEGVPCGATSTRVLDVGWPIGAPRDGWDPVTFVQDPDGTFAATWSLEEPFDPDATLPEDGYSTGLTDGRVEIWVSPSAGDRAIWARIGDRFERWPKAGPWGVTDCN